MARRLDQADDEIVQHLVLGKGSEQERLHDE
jgi:hypothetical protein